MLGSLVEKSLSTPQQYPLTINAVVAACNQSSNRQPVVSYDEDTVAQALQSLKDMGLVRFVHPSHGRSAIRYRSVLHEMLAMDDNQQALVCLLLLRGPQTAGELRGRTERMADLEGLRDVEETLERLAGGDDPPVERMPRQAGHKETRWRQRLVSDLVAPAPPSDVGDGDRATAIHEEASDGGRSEAAALRGEVAALRSEVAALRGEVAALRSEGGLLRQELDDLRNRLGD